MRAKPDLIALGERAAELRRSALAGVQDVEARDALIDGLLEHAARLEAALDAAGVPATGEGDEHEARLRQVARLSSDPIMRSMPGVVYRLSCEVAPSGKRANAHFEFVSDSCRELLRYAPEDLERDARLLCLADPEHHDTARREVAVDHLALEQSGNRLRFHCGDGSWRWMLQRSRRTATDGDRLTVEGLLVDIDGQVEAEEALERRVKLLQTVIDTVPVAGITMRDREMRHLLMNAGAARFFNLGIPVSSIIGKRIDELVPDWTPTIGETVHESVLRTGEPVVGVEYESVLVPGTWRMLSAAPVHAADGTVEAVVQVNIDITERKLAERALESHRDHLEEMVAARTRELSQEIVERERAERALLRSERLVAIGQVVSAVSHELRNPLGTIENSMALMDDQLTSPGQRWRPTRQRIQRSIDRCVEIIESMLGYGQARSLDRRDVDIDDWCRDLVARMDVPDGVEVQCGLESGVRLSVDGERLGQAVANLVRNGWQAASETATPSRPATVSVRTSVEGYDLRIDVSDNGPGIPQPDLDRIFEPLFSTRSSGLGLGLPLARRLVEDESGHIEVTTSPEGATFTCRIPVNGDPDERKTPASQELPPDSA